VTLPGSLRKRRTTNNLAPQKLPSNLRFVLNNLAPQKLPSNLRFVFLSVRMRGLMWPADRACESRSGWVLPCSSPQLAFPPPRRSPSLSPAAAHRGLPTAPPGRSRLRRRRRGSPRLRHRRGEGHRRGAMCSLAGQAWLGGTGGRMAPGSWGRARVWVAGLGLGPGVSDPGSLDDRRMRPDPIVRADSAAEAEELRAPRVGLARGCSADIHHPRPQPRLVLPASTGLSAAEPALALFFFAGKFGIFCCGPCAFGCDFLSR
jgi:hypothetical protein